MLKLFASSATGGSTEPHGLWCTAPLALSVWLPLNGAITGSDFRPGMRQKPFVGLAVPRSANRAHSALQTL